MTWNEVFCHTFKALSEELNLPTEERSMVDCCRADDSELCLEAVGKGWLTDEQMRHAAERYRLGKSRQGKTIYWMIDEHGVCHDGHVGNSWISEILKRRYPEAAQYIRARHCLFGQHLLGHTESTESTEIGPVAHGFHEMLVRAYPFCDFRDFCVKKSIGLTEKNPFNPFNPLFF